MLGEKCLCEVYQIGNDFVVPIRPEGGELKAVAGLFGFVPSLALLFDVAAAGGVGIILRVGAVGDDENLDIFKQAACRPEAVAPGSRRQTAPGSISTKTIRIST